METDWEEVTCIVHPAPAPNALPTKATVLAFDAFQELLWSGNDYGRVTSFYGRSLERYTSYRAHLNEGAVRQILVNEKGIISIGPRSVHFATRRGLAQWHIQNELFEDLQCTSFTAKGQNEILVAGCQDTMFQIDVEKGVIVNTHPAKDLYTMMKRGGQYICAATHSGSVNILDPNTFAVVKSWKAHSAWINDMDAKSDYLVTCGYSSRHQLGFLLDPLANVFDLKTLVPLPPIPFHAGAACVRMHPRMSTTAIIASQTGQLQVVDIMNPHSVSVRQVYTYETHLIGLDIAPSGEAFVFGDGGSMIHLWGHPARIKFAEYSEPTVFADSPNPPIVPAPSVLPMDWFQNPNAPLNAVGMPYYREQLLSAWPKSLICEVGAPPAIIDPEILKHQKRAEIGSWSPNPRKTLRNQVPEKASRGNPSEPLINVLSAPRFLSEKARDIASGSDDGNIADDLDKFDKLGLVDIGSTPKTLDEVPAIYKRVEIKYSKFGVEDFDFQFFNKTVYSGLETDIANHYVNPLLQMYKYTTIIRNLALDHTATSCLSETCLLCEMGFLFDMLEKAHGQNCHSTNFLRTFGSLSESASLGVREEHFANRPLTVMIQSVNRFLLGKIVKDYNHIVIQHGLMNEALSTVGSTFTRCAWCSNTGSRSEEVFTHELMYPRKPVGKLSNRPTRPSFSQVLKAGVEGHSETRGWCNKCNMYRQLMTSRMIQSIPSVLMINTSIDGNEARQLWATPGWLPQEIGVIINQGQFYCYEGQDLKLHQKREAFNMTVYELVGVVADINSGENQKSHLVSLINVALTSPAPSAEDQWYLFNDFLVRPTNRAEALWFDPIWKLPSILTYQKKNPRPLLDDSWKHKLDQQILYRRWPVNQQNDAHQPRPLDPATEAPVPGTPVAIDGEFVELRRAEKEFKADGTTTILRPAQVTLARVSVLRGGSPTKLTATYDLDDPSPMPSEDASIPFIDDYIAVSDPIVDYHTSYSGIKPGDLDRATSIHPLVSLKVAYKKIWLLLNLGCIFVGHGLSKDFRTINLHVPRATQVVDTVDLFFLPKRQRKLSLKFLAWYFLREDVQVGLHDSVEDARTALRLWRKWEEIRNGPGGEDEVTRSLERCYDEGRKTNFKVPGSIEAEAVRLGGGTGTATGGTGTPEPGTRTPTAARASTPTRGLLSGGPSSAPGRNRSLTPGRSGFGAGRVRGPEFGGSPVRRG